MMANMPGMRNYGRLLQIAGPANTKSASEIISPVVWLLIFYIKLIGL